MAGDLGGGDAGTATMGALTSFATGNPIGALAGIAGLGLSIFGGIDKYNAANQMNTAAVNMLNIEQQQDQVRRKAMEVASRRSMMEQVRMEQKARSMAVAGATGSGAQFGSALGGSIGSIGGSAGNNQLGISQNLMAGEQMFDLNAQLTQQKIAYTNAQTQMTQGGQFQQAGGALLGSVGTFGQLFPKGMIS